MPRQAKAKATEAVVEETMEIVRTPRLPKSHYRVTARKMLTRAPVTVAQHDGARMPRGNGAFLPDSLSELQTLTEEKECVATVPFMIVANDYHNEINKKGRPYIPATSFRGALRSIAARIITKGMIGKLSHGVMSALLVGGVIENKKTKDRKVQNLVASGVDEKEARKTVEPFNTEWAKFQAFEDRDHGLPLFALFGYNNPTFLKGFDSFNVLLSEGDFTLQRVGIVRQPYVHQERDNIDKLSYAGLRELQEASAIERDAVSEKNAASKAKSDANKIVAALEKQNRENEGSVSAEELAAAKAARDAASQSATDADKNREVASGQLHGKWVIPAGVNFSFSLSHRMNDEDLGLLILTLRAFGASPKLGGDKGRYGGGDFEMNFEIERYDEATRKFVSVGSVRNDDHDAELDQFVDAFEAKIDDYQEKLLTLKS